MRSPLVSRSSLLLPACRRFLFPLLHAEKGPFPRATKEIGDVCTQASLLATRATWQMTRLTRWISSDFSYPIQAKLLETHPTYTAPVKRVFSFLISLNAVPPILSFSQNRRVLTEGVLHPSWHFRHLRLTGFFVYGEIRKCSRAVKAC